MIVGYPLEAIGFTTTVSGAPSVCGMPCAHSWMLNQSRIHTLSGNFYTYQSPFSWAELPALDRWFTRTTCRPMDPA